jgi:hypothetical protein
MIIFAINYLSFIIDYLQNTYIAQLNEFPMEKKTTQGSMFTKENYMWMAAGAVVIALGMILMSGGKSDNPAVFDEKQVYSTTRITIAPILILLGLGIEIFAIFKRPKA